MAQSIGFENVEDVRSLLNEEDDVFLAEELKHEPQVRTS